MLIFYQSVSKQKKLCMCHRWWLDWLNWLIRKDWPTCWNYFLEKSNFRKYVCCRSWLNGWIEYLSKSFSRKSLFLHRYVSQKLVEWLNWPTRWENFIARSYLFKYVFSKSWLKRLNWYSSEKISLVSIFWRHASQTLVELVDSRRFAKFFFGKVYF